MKNSRDVNLQTTKSNLFDSPSPILVTSPHVFVLCYVPFEIIALMETSPLSGEDSKTMEHNLLLELFTKK